MEGEWRAATHEPQDTTMLLSIIVTLIIAGTLGYALRGAGRDQLIIRRPYNNRYNDASGAREDAVLE
jgi:hypothetical protein